MEERDLPLWVSNEKKYDRAVQELKKAGKEVTEEAIKEVYIKYGGLVITEEMIAEREEVIKQAEEAAKPRKNRRIR